MQLSKEHLLAQLDHQQKIHEIHRKTLFVLEERAATFGINIPVEIMNQINWVRSQMEAIEQEINRLETHVSEDKMPIAEVEYRVALAEAWDNASGVATILDRERLELTRMRLHISPERAKILEKEIRINLAVENVMYRDGEMFLGTGEFEQLLIWLTGEKSDNIKEIMKYDVLRPLFRTISLAPVYAFGHLSIFANVKSFDIKKVSVLVYGIIYREEYDEVIEDLKKAIREDNYS